MTIVCAMKDTDGVWIGSDSRVTSAHGTIITDDYRKWFRKWFRIGEETWIGLAGHIRVERLIGKLSPTQNAPTIWDIVDELHRLVKEDGWTAIESKDGTPQDFCYDAIIVNHGKVWLTHGSGSVLDMGDKFTAIGSGMHFACGAAFAFGGGVQIAIRTALEAACHYDRDCGGELFIEKIKT
ncbi:MAG: hypothetical protein KGL39_29505 [Patescibacteria group bacterium]|nr:hypothetical protein [Patescibacteria group bacterium]